MENLTLNYRYLDMASYSRKDHFNYFSSLAYPYVGTTANIDITDFLKTVKEQKLPFFLTFCYCVSRTANLVPEFRQRIDGDRAGRRMIMPVSVLCNHALVDGVHIADFYQV